MNGIVLLCITITISKKNRALKISLSGSKSFTGNTKDREVLFDPGGTSSSRTSFYVPRLSKISISRFRGRSASSVSIWGSLRCSTLLTRAVGISLQLKVEYFYVLLDYDFGIVEWRVVIKCTEEATQWYLVAEITWFLLNLTLRGLPIMDMWVPWMRMIV